MARVSNNFLLAIYDAALSDENWPAALAAFAREIAGVGAFVVATDDVGLPFHIQEASYPLEQLKYYFEHFGRYDEENLVALSSRPPMILNRDIDMPGDMKGLDDRPDYKWLWENIGARRKAGVRLNHGKGWSDAILLQFAHDWGPSLDPIQIQLDVLLPHIAKVVEINRKFTLLRNKYRAVLTALDHVLIGTCVSGPNQQILVANKAAQHIFDLDDGLSLNAAGMIAALTANTTAEIEEGLRRASQTASGQCAQHESVVFAKRKSGSQPFLIEISPLRDSVGELQNNLTGAIVFIIDPENTRSISIDRMARLFFLTSAEGEVCRHMIAGLSAPEIAERRGVTEGTIKSQFKSIHLKTGVSRRADLLRLAVTVDPPIAKPA